MRKKEEKLQKSTNENYNTYNNTTEELNNDDQYFSIQITIPSGK